MDFKAAGVLFTDGHNFLSGVQSRDGVFVFDGFGGAREQGEDVLTTAYRETFEEMFEPTNLTSEAINRAKDLIIPQRVLIRETYGLVVCDLHDISKFLQIANEVGLHSPLYNQIPLTLGDLISKRDTTSKKAEIRQLMLINKTNKTLTPFPIANTFLGDMEILDPQ